MFEIGFPELLLIAIVGLLVIGPERLPEALRTLGLWIGRMRRSFTSVKTEIEREIGMDEVRRQLHNEAVMEEMRRIEREVRESVDQRNPGAAPANGSAAAGEGSAAKPASEDAPAEPAAAGAAEPARPAARGYPPQPPNLSGRAGEHDAPEPPSAAPGARPTDRHG